MSHSNIQIPYSQETRREDPSTGSAARDRRGTHASERDGRPWSPLPPSRWLTICRGEDLSPISRRPQCSPARPRKLLERVSGSFPMASGGRDSCARGLSLCASGRGMAAARSAIRRTPARVVSVSWPASAPELPRGGSDFRLERKNLRADSEARGDSPVENARSGRCGCSRTRKLRPAFCVVRATEIRAPAR